jgi:hypothetical protein
VQGSRAKILKPQKDWDALSPAVGIPKDAKEAFFLPTKKTISDREVAEVENFVLERETVRAPSSQQDPPRRRGKPRENKEIMGVQVAEGPPIRLIAEELL